MLTGCLVPNPTPVAARMYNNGWVGVQLAGEATLYVDRSGGAPLIVAGRRSGLIVAYGDHVRGMPRRVHVRTTPPGSVATDVTAVLSQVSINVEIDARAFARTVPRDFTPTSIDTLQPDAGPLAVSGETARGAPPGGAPRPQP